LPSKKTATNKTTAKKSTATAKKSTATAKKSTATAKKSTATAKKSTAKNTTAGETMGEKTSNPPQPGDLIVIDSAQVGSPARQGEILKVIDRGLAVSYEVKWADGHETLITPAAGTAHILPT
jgi:hypothetical protein